MRSTQLSDVRFDALLLFVRVAQEHSIVAAGRDLGLTASSATRKLMALEQALGARLFSRSTRSIRLTDAGATALEWAQDALAALDQTSDSLATITGTPSGRIRLAAPHFGMSTYLPTVFATFCEKYPKLSLDLTTTDELVNLIDDQFDVVIRYGVLPDSRNVATRVTQFNRVVCAAPSYLEKFGTPKMPQELLKHHCIVHKQSDPTTWNFSKDSKVMYQPIAAKITLDNMLAIELLSRKGAGIARLPDITFSRSSAAGTLVQLFRDYDCVEPSGDKPSIWIVHNARDLAFRVRLLVDHLKREIPSARRHLYGLC